VFIGINAECFERKADEYRLIKKEEWDLQGGDKAFVPDRLAR
jgi:hypothetical protein